MTTAPEGRGGYRAPSNPAAVSGPGALSQRTDGGPTQGARYVSGLPYGQGQQTYSNQVAAPMAGNSMGASAMGNSGLVQMEMPTELMAPTNRPNEPITAGLDIGEGPGSEIMNLPTTTEPLSVTMRKIAQFDPTGEAELIYSTLAEYGY
jgi:hypothetical protein